MWQTLLSVVVGGILAIGGGIAQQWWQRRQDRRSLAYALAGEIGAIIESIELRRYTEAIDGTIEQVKKTGTPWTFTIDIAEGYFLVYGANAGKIGLLSPLLAKEVAAFYSMMVGLIEDVAPRNNVRARTVEQSLAQLTQTRDLGLRTLQRGKALVALLEQVN